MFFRRPGARPLFAPLFVLALTAVPASAAQQSDASTARGAGTDTLVFQIDPVIVTATRGPREVSATPRPVSVLGRAEVRDLAPNSISDLLIRLPGLDVTGVGVNQVRPSIRGQRGQRILLLQDGMRMNNSRRQQDFGELPALVDVTGVDRVEIVRGPASVLYGSDAIGGVINILTRAPEGEGIQGTASYRYGDVEGQQMGSMRLFGRTGRLSFQAGGTLRNANPYLAPSGSFGQITLDDDVTVNDTGVQDRSADLRLGWDVNAHVHAFGKFEFYDAEDAGFGHVDPSAYGAEAMSLELRYPNQTFRKGTFGVRLEQLDNVIADRIEITAYGQENVRDYTSQLFVPFGIPGRPDAGIGIDSDNFTDVATFGMRAEARKLVDDGLLVTYGVDAFRDRVRGTDLSTTTVSGFGPPQVEIDPTPSLPEATFLNAGAFAQAEVDLGDRLTLIGGGRYTHIAAETFRTDGLDLDPRQSTDGKFVAAVNALYRATERVSLIAAVGQAFRAPNLVERFFEGEATIGGYQIANPDLAPETSTNVDLGMRYRGSKVGFEVFAFRNDVRDGVRIADLGVQINGQDAYQNVNIDHLRYQGFEVSADLRLGRGFTLLGSYTDLGSEDVDDPENPVGDTFSTKTTASLRYDHPGARFWVQWDSRFQGDQRDVVLMSNPLGDHIPAFDVHHLRGGMRLFEIAGAVHRVNIGITNLTDRLYAEATNASFFRPAPKRNLTLTYEVSF